MERDQAKRDQVVADTYLTDGETLYRVAKAYRAMDKVLLEDAKHPDLPLEEWSVKRLLGRGLRVVRPA